MANDKFEKVDWPSERVAKGGIFHPQKVAYSKDTHDLIKCIDFTILNGIYYVIFCFG